MKKFLAGLASLALVAVICFSFVACGKGYKQLEGKTFVLEDVELYFSTEYGSRENASEEWTVKYGTTFQSVMDYCKMQVMNDYNDNGGDPQIESTADLTPELLKKAQEKFDSIILGSTEEHKVTSQITFKDGKVNIETSTTVTYADGTTETTKTISMCDYEMKDGRIVMTAIVDNNEIVYTDVIRLHNDSEICVNNTKILKDINDKPYEVEKYFRDNSYQEKTVDGTSYGNAEYVSSVAIYKMV